MHIFRGN